MARHRVLLINPKTVNRYCHYATGTLDRLYSFFFSHKYERRFHLPSHSHFASMPPVTLLALEPLFASRADVQVVDEQTDAIDFDADVDMVGITATTPQINRAFEIAARFRARGIATILGGVHATCMPDACSPHVDAVCVGEAEGYIDELFDDFSRGNLQRRYVNRTVVSMADTPFYNYDIGAGKYFPFHVINASRGCVFDCEFCSIRSTFGAFRPRPIEQVVSRIREVGCRNIWFTDATLTASAPYARALFKALVPLNIRWLGQITLNVARDESMLDLMARSGCWLAGTGFESLSPGSLKSAHKAQNRVGDYARIIKALHDRQIAIDGNFVFGFDEDREDVFDSTADFALETGIDFPDFYVLTPYPDTALYQRYLAAGRIADFDWSHYDNAHFFHLPVFEPRHMSRETLREGCRRAEKKVYNYCGTLRRLFTARVRHPAVWIANFVYAQRLARRGDLAPVGEDAPTSSPPFKDKLAAPVAMLANAARE